MMLKLKKNIVEMLKTLIKPEKLNDTVLSLEKIMDGQKEDFEAFDMEFDIDVAKRPCTLEFTLNDFQEELVPYKWYKRELFDGNPKGYWLVERDKWVGDCGEECITASSEDLTALKESTSHFMYIKNVWR